MKGFYFITDNSLSKNGNESDIISAENAKVEMIQYRNKNSTTKAMFDEALNLKKLCNYAKFIINDRIDIALAIDADGVHLGQDDMPYPKARQLIGPNKIIGLTVHNLKEALEAENLGADYIGVSPIFTTTTKKDAGNPSGIQLIKDIKSRINLPIVAIGGINQDNANETFASGADMICAISAVVTKDDVEAEIKKFQEMIR